MAGSKSPSTGQHLVEHGITGGQLLVPGSVMTLLDGRCEVAQPGADPMRPFTHKRAYLEDYAARMRPAIELRRAQRAALSRTPDLLGRLKAWWEPLLEVADHICDGVGGPVLLDFGEDRIVIDFPERAVRLPEADEKYRNRFDIERGLVEDILRTNETDSVNNLPLAALPGVPGRPVQRVHLLVLQMPLGRTDLLRRGLVRRPQRRNRDGHSRRLADAEALPTPEG